MGIAGIVLAVFTSGYILGVWAACMVLKQPQKVYEDGVPVPIAGARALVARVVGAERRL
ncbi:MAG TPA: hypothetical protein VNU19_18790 [Candidatus Acidoferrum sp.]|jgi:hypothetical protein|nr:hypothetical protein [Candidatus Acidoferrum sp.]